MPVISGRVALWRGGLRCGRLDMAPIRNSNKLIFLIASGLMISGAVRPAGEQRLREGAQSTAQWGSYMEGGRNAGSSCLFFFARSIGRACLARTGAATRLGLADLIWDVPFGPRGFWPRMG